MAWGEAPDPVVGPRRNPSKATKTQRKKWYHEGGKLDRLMERIAKYHRGLIHTEGNPPVALPLDQQQFADVIFVHHPSRPSDKPVRSYAHGFNVDATGGAAALLEVIKAHLAGDVAAAYERDVRQILATATFPEAAKQEFMTLFLAKRTSRLVSFYFIFYLASLLSIYYPPLCMYIYMDLLPVFIYIFFSLIHRFPFSLAFCYILILSSASDRRSPQRPLYCPRSRAWGCGS